jgi:prepilin-type N-terminal cleavage/methylation domain-containing protein
MYGKDEIEARLSRRHLHSMTKLARALTLVEVVIVIAIVAVLVAIVLPVLSSSRRNAQQTSDLQKLRQLGVAANLYREETGVWPRSAIDVIEAQQLPPELCSFSGDRTQTGMANELAAAMARGNRDSEGANQSTYHNSPLGLKEFYVPDRDVSRFVVNGQAGGWLIDATRAKQVPPDALSSIGTYTRLCFDSSIVKRQFSDSQCRYADGELSPCRIAISYFVDPSDEMKQWILSL